MENTSIKLNNNYTFAIDSFSRNTLVQDGKLVSNAYVTLKDPVTTDIETLRGIALYAITSLKLIHEEEEIYELSDLDAHITSIDESLSDDGKIRVSFYMYF